MSRGRRAWLLVGGALALAGCGSPAATPVAAPTTQAVPTMVPTAAAPSTTRQPVTTTPAPVDTGASPAPGWLGTRVLAVGPAGYPAARPTPPELLDRRIVTTDVLPPPADGAFHSTVTPVPDSVVRRSTWTAGCPVTLAELRYVTVTFRGFDGRPHTGELLLHRDIADAAVTVFSRLFAAGFPMERMVVTSPAEVAAKPTGDGNTTAAFVCRATRGTTTWSAHAFGRAIDVNPFQNPYLSGTRVIPELATAYLDRGRVLPGVITATGPVVAAFRAVGWTWGGSWTSPTDYMHFSSTGH
ncbi:MAG TPA: M15 family metallopeptidase [Mycobacteriales bacterium]|nr:M15 family metallopeptidase [Mycobacteriales bacterium]